MVRVRQLVDEVVEAYSQALQVCSLHWLQQLAIYEDFPCPQTCKSVNSSFTYDALVKIWLIFGNFCYVLMKLIQSLQVPERNRDIDMSDYYFEFLADSWEKLKSLHQGAAWHNKNCYKAYHCADLWIKVFTLIFFRCHQQDPGFPSIQELHDRGRVPDHSSRHCR